MNHFVLTRSAYGRAWTPEANRRRLGITAAVTARLMAVQTSRDWTWVVLLDRTDPLLEERQAVFAAAAPSFIPLLWTPPAKPSAAPWDRRAAVAGVAQRVAAAAYKAPWREAIGDPAGKVLMTRLDDDDGLAVDAIERYQVAAEPVTRRTILMLPSGVRVWRSRYSEVIHRQNAMHTLVTPAGERGTVYDYGHATCRTGHAVIDIDHKWGWLWVRHWDTISGYRRADAPITRAVRASFPVDWSSLTRAWTQ